MPIINSHYMALVSQYYLKRSNIMITRHPRQNCRECIKLLQDILYEMKLEFFNDPSDFTEELMNYTRQLKRLEKNYKKLKGNKHD